MEEHTDEIYERIPWESIENTGRDRQWLAIGVAAALVAGALGYSFVSNRGPALPPPSEPQAADVVESAPVPEAIPPVAPPSTGASPVVVSEADLYAVPPDQLAREAASHAEWFMIEYLTVDGSGSDNSTLRSLLPAHIPLPSVGPDVLVFVEWIGASAVEEVSPGVFRVDVAARYMVAEDGATYVRVPPENFTVDVVLSDGGPTVTEAPTSSPAVHSTPPSGAFSEVPESVGLQVLERYPEAELVGGNQLADGSWRVTFMNARVGGVTRPESMLVTPP